MTLLHLFWAFFVPNILGYGGGPPIIPLLQQEIVNHYGWLDMEQFGDVLALGNALPSPIATKLAGYIGYQVAGIPGAAVALFATIAPTALAMIVLFKFLAYFKKAPQVAAMTQMVRPVVAVLLAALALQFFTSAYAAAGIWQTAALTFLSLLALEKFKIHPAIVVSAGLLYGALALG